MILLVMGVAGCGKTTVGTELAAKLGWSFADADDFHSDANKSKMAEGRPLNDQDRIPWLLSLHEQIDKWSSIGQNAVLTCSALRRSYRCILLFGSKKQRNSNEQTDAGIEEDAASNRFQLPNDFADFEHASESFTTQKCSHGIKHSLVFVFLRTSKEALTQRLKERSGHFMPSSLLQSQLETLEEPEHPEQFITLDGDKNVHEIVEECLSATILRNDLLMLNQ